MGNAIFKSENSNKAWQPLVTDKAARKAVLKQNFSIDKVPSDLDAIVIGSGIGGLATAACLSLAGKKVLVLEQHHKAGGCCHVFKEKGYEFDVGIHYLGLLASPNSEFQILLDNICHGKIKFQPMDDIYDEVVIGERHIPIYKGKDKCKSELQKEFPGETTSIDKFFSLCEDEEASEYTFGLLKFLLPQWLASWCVSTGLYKLFGQWLKYVSQSTEDVVKSLTDNPHLQTVFTYCYGDYGVSPKRSPFIMQAMLWNYFRSEGGFYPVGGGSEFPFQIIQTIENAGGRVLVRAPVSEIILDESGGAGKPSAVGVRVSRPNGDLIEIRAPVIVSAAGYTNTYKKLIKRPLGDIDQSPGTSSGDLTKTGTLHPGVATIILFVGLSGSSEELGLPARNYWVYTDGTDHSDIMDRYLEVSDVHEAMESGGELPILFISFPSAKDPTWKHRYPDKSVCEVVTFANYEWFSEWNNEQVKKRADDYQRIKEKMMMKLWHQCLKQFPHLENKVDVMEFGTPVSNNYYLGSSRGEIYGLDHDQYRFNANNLVKLRPTQAEVNNLYLSGQDVFTCGVVGGMLGGMNCASSILSRSLYLELQWCRLRIALQDRCAAWAETAKGWMGLSAKHRQD